jgi:spore coat polysaccharide biosynthesis protein SpsF (cytidylyltransferase family)
MSKPRVVAFIQARLTSSRLPNKVLEKIGPWTAIELMSIRLGACKTLDDIVFVIPDSKPNDPLDTYLQETLKSKIVRGSEDDVLGRFAVAMKAHDADYYVRLTADCPLICPELVDDVVNLAVEHKLAYATNTNPPTFPDGFDVECVSREALTWTQSHVKNPHWREHVTYGLRESPEKPQSFEFGNVTQDGPSAAWMRMTLDTPEDLAMFREFYKVSGSELKFATHDSLQSLYQSESLFQINGQHTRNEGFQLSGQREYDLNK